MSLVPEATETPHTYTFPELSKATEYAALFAALLRLAIHPGDVAPAPKRTPFGIP
jgi:hypothetical protein